MDAKLERDTDVYDEAFSLDRVLLAIEPAKQLRLVILDACRDNPFAKSMKRTVASRAIGQGLAKVEPTSPNMLIAYSAKAGSTAADGDGKNSPFTMALSKHLTTPGLDVRRAFGFVRDDVLKTTGNRQEPFVYGSLGGDDVPLVPAPQGSAPAAAPAPNPQAEARRDYELALQIGNKSALNAFLAQYPDGFYAEPRQSCSSKDSPPRKRASPPPKRRGWPNRSGHGLPPRARKRRSRQRPRPMRRRPSRRASLPRRPSRSPRTRPPPAEQKRARSARKPPTTRLPTRLRRQQGCRPWRRRPAKETPGSRRAERRVAAGRRHKIGADRIAPRRLPHRCRRWRMEHGVAALADAVQPATPGPSSTSSSPAPTRSMRSSSSRRGSVRWSASTASRPMATAAAESSAPRAHSSMTTMNARSGARRSRSPSATGDDRERAAPLRPQAKQVIVGRSQAPTSASTARSAAYRRKNVRRVATHTRAIMSGKCP